MKEYCVTGGTGFIASNLLKILLQRGHIVRATVRDPDDEFKVGWLWRMEGAKQRLKLFKADLMVEGSFDEAVSGVDGVFHTASPVIVDYHHGNVQGALINPCVKGTLNVLKSCSNSRNSIKRVVLTSSCSSIRYGREHGVGTDSELNESHWSDLDYCRRHNLWYAYAKTVGEQEAWRASEHWGLNLVVVNPSFVVGPLIAPEPTSTLLLILFIVRGDSDSYPNTTVGFVHIDDVVSAHILAMEDGRAAGRLVCSSTVAHWSEIIHMLKTEYPQYRIANKCGNQKGDDTKHTMDCSKIKGLGLTTFASLPQMLHDCITSFQLSGLL